MANPSGVSLAKRGSSANVGIKLASPPWSRTEARNVALLRKLEDRRGKLAMRHGAQSPQARRAHARLERVRAAMPQEHVRAAAASRRGAGDLTAARVGTLLGGHSVQHVSPIGARPFPKNPKITLRSVRREFLG